MSSGTITPPSMPAEPQPEPSSYDAFIEERLRRTRRQVKGVDVAGGLVVLAIGTLAYLLAAVVIDHWVVFGGLGTWGRVLLWLGLLAGAGCYFARRVLLPLVWRINPIFAAYTIEQSRPSLKNSLINFLLLRGHRREVPQPVYRAVEHRAAADLSQIEIEAAVDRGHVIRLGYVLVAVVAVCGLYRVISPKNPFSSAARVLWPWSDIAAPTRVTIVDVKPGNAVKFHGEFLTVSAEVDGLRDGETVALYYSTADGQTVNQKIPMLAEGGYRHQGKLPPEDLGLQQDVDYYLTAGDYTTPRFTVDVQTAPTILVSQIEYDYPAYTGFSDQVVKRLGDIRAIEGTQITIRAAANRTIQWAMIDLGCNGLRELQMQSQGKTAAGSFTLRLDPDDPSRPEHDCYQLRFRDDAGRLNPRPTRHRIEVIRDLPPEIEWVSPQQEEVQLAEDGRLEIRVRAQDPDFALRKVVLRAESGGRSLVIPPLLDKPHPGEFQESYLFEPARARFEVDASEPTPSGLTAGDRVRYWAEAEDNKEPAPGRAASAQRWITIVEPSSRQQQPQRPDGQGQGTGERPKDGSNQPPQGQVDRNQQPQEDRPSDPAERPQAEDQPPPQEDGSQGRGPQQDPSAQGPPGQEADSTEPGDGSRKPEAGAVGQDQQQPAEGQSDQPPEPIDPETQGGDAIDEILKHREQQQQEQDGQKSDPQQPGQEPSGGQKSGEQQGGQEPSGGQKSGEQQGGQEPSGGQKSGEQQGGQEPSGGQKSGEQKPGEERSGDQKSGEQQGGKPQDGGRQAAGSEDGTQQGAKQQGGQQEDTQRKSPGAGEPSADETGPPAAQGDNQERQKQPGEIGQESGKKQPADSPSISPHESDSQGDTSGDRSGGGKRGGGQRSKQSGTGSAGSQTEADDGGSAGKQPGDGQTGLPSVGHSDAPPNGRAGGQVETEGQTGSSQTRRGSPGSDGRQEPGGVGPDELQGDRDGPAGDQRPQQDPGEGGRPGDGTSAGPDTPGRGNPTAGSGPGKKSDTPSSPEATEPGGEDPNLEFARKATDLALVHLKDEMEQDDSELLDRLGWSREEARKFLQKWEQMKRAAAQEGPQGEAARGQLDRALKSLGLRPRGTRLQGDGARTDPLRDLREAGRFDPPSDWTELFREYRRGVAGGGRQ